MALFLSVLKNLSLLVKKTYLLNKSLRLLNKMSRNSYFPIKMKTTKRF